LEKTFVPAMDKAVEVEVEGRGGHLDKTEGMKTSSSRLAKDSSENRYVERKKEES
jgi:hypothetical protein